MPTYDIKAIRQVHKISQRELAESIGVSQVFVSRIEQGKEPFPQERLQRLYDAYPRINFEEYEIHEEEPRKRPGRPRSVSIEGSTVSLSNSPVLSGNKDSELRINDPEFLNHLISMMAEVLKRGEKEGRAEKQIVENDDAQIAAFRESAERDRSRIAKLEDQNDQLRQKIEEKLDEIEELRQKIMDLKTLLVENNIPLPESNK